MSDGGALVDRWLDSESAATAEFPSSIPLREPARVWSVNGQVVVVGPICCGARMTDVGGCSSGCCDDYRCGRCGREHRVEWPD